MSVYVRLCAKCRAKRNAERAARRAKGDSRRLRRNSGKAKNCPDCKYAVRTDLDLGPHGERRRRFVGTYETKDAAERAERGALRERDNGIDVDPGSATVADLVEQFLKDAAPRLAATTRHGYRAIADKLILPRVGRLTVSRARPAHFADWITGIRERGGHRGKPLSAKSVKHAFVLLSSVFKHGIRLQIAATNPLAAISLPRVPRSKAKALSPDEIRSVLDAAAKTRLGPFVAFALATALRRGELCGLNWSDCDAERKTILVERSLCETKDGVKLKTTKTERSRTIPLSRMATEALERQRLLQAENRRQARKYVLDPSKPIFTDEIGRRLSPLATTKAYGQIARTAGISTTRLHDLRHSAATHLLVAGVDVRSVSGILGHASASTTLNCYAHVLADAQRDGIDRLGERLERIVADSR